VLPYFLEIKNGFTKYELAAALSLQSVYSQKLYELFSSWKNKKRWSVSVDELRTLLMAESYKEYKNFKMRCLTAPIREINKKTDLRITCQEIKHKKAVVGLEFLIEKEIDERRSAAEAEYKEILALSPGERANASGRLFKDYSFRREQQNDIVSIPALFEKFVEIDGLIFNGVLDPENPTAYMAKCLKEVVKEF